MSSKATYSWPDPDSAVDDFYDVHLKAPLALFADLQVKTRGSGRPAGRRRTLWSATCMLAVASLEAGLEELVFSAFGVLTGRAGATKREIRRTLVEDPLVTPGPVKIARLLEAHFGVELDRLPKIARFEARRKMVAKGGSGKGDPVAGPRSWADLGRYHEALMHIRNGAAHGDTTKIHNPPSTAEGLLWVIQQGGGWSIQQPHAYTALCTVVSVFNTVAHGLDRRLSLFANPTPLRHPNDVVRYQ